MFNIWKCHPKPGQGIIAEIKYQSKIWKIKGKASKSDPTIIIFPFYNAEVGVNIIRWKPLNTEGE